MSFIANKKRENVYFGMQSIDKNLDRILRPIFQGSKKEFILINNLSKNWQDIIGIKYKKFCYPKSVTFNKKTSNFKLTIAVFNPSIGFFIEQNSEIILDRISSFYGFKSIEKIIIKQEPKNIKDLQHLEINLPQEKENFLQKNLENIKNQDLAETLKILGKMIMKKT